MRRHRPRVVVLPAKLRARVEATTWAAGLPRTVVRLVAPAQLPPSALAGPMTRLAELDLTEAPAVDVPALAQFLLSPAARRLRRLSLFRCRSLEADGYEQVMLALAGVPRLHTLDVSHMSMRASHIQALALALGTLPDLHTLRMAGTLWNEVLPTAWNALADALRQHPSLTVLDLGTNKSLGAYLDRFALPHALASLIVRPGAELYLAGSQLAPEAVQALATSIGSERSQLRVLDLSHNSAGITARNVDQVLGSLARCPTLETVNLAGSNQAGDEAALATVRALTGGWTVRTLSLAASRITSFGAEQLAAHLHQARRLEVLDLTTNTLGRGLYAHRRTNPEHHVRIRWDPGA